MNTEEILKMLNEKPNLAVSIGMILHYDEANDEFFATMEANAQNCHPFGKLSGGATLAMAETLAGVASVAICPKSVCVGVSVSANHAKAVNAGETVTAHASLLCSGKAIHVWQVNVTNEQGELISTVSVTNYIKGANRPPLTPPTRGEDFIVSFGFGLGFLKY